MIVPLSYRLSGAKVIGQDQPDLRALRSDVPLLRNRTPGTPYFSPKAGALPTSPKLNNLRLAGTGRVLLEEEGVRMTMGRTGSSKGWSTV